LANFNNNKGSSADNRSNACLAMLYLFGAPCYGFFTPYALYQDAVQAHISTANLSKYSPVALPSFLSILSSNWMILKAFYDQCGGVFMKK
jgi:hypothetical protein